MSILQDIYNEATSGIWKDLDQNKCGCRGRGWFLSDVDTWHHCHIHNTGQAHPEDDYDREPYVLTQEDIDHAGWCCFSENWVNLGIYLNPVDIPF